MVKVFVAQTHDRERDAVCSFLEAAGYHPKPYGTSPSQLNGLCRELLFLETPAALVTSQRDLFGCDYISRLLHAYFLSKPKLPTLTVIYSRAVAYPQNIHHMSEYLLEMFQISTQMHTVKLVPKAYDTTQQREHGKVLGHIQNFEASLIPQNP